MAIVDPVSGVRRTMQTSHATEIFASTVVADVAMGTESNIPDRITEPLKDMGTALDEVTDVLLGDADEEEGNEGDAADEIAVLPRRRGKVSSQQAAGVEDAF